MVVQVCISHLNNYYCFPVIASSTTGLPSFAKAAINTRDSVWQVHSPDGFGVGLGACEERGQQESP